MSTQREIMDTGAALLTEQAEEIGSKCRLPRQIAAVTLLERALAVAWCDVLMFQGANPSPERLEECIRLMTKRISDETRAQAILRKGHNATYGKKRQH